MGAARRPTNDWIVLIIAGDESLRPLNDGPSDKCSLGGGNVIASSRILNLFERSSVAGGQRFWGNSLARKQCEIIHLFIFNICLIPNSGVCAAVGGGGGSGVSPSCHKMKAGCNMHWLPVHHLDHSSCVSVAVVLNCNVLGFLLSGVHVQVCTVKRFHFTCRACFGIFGVTQGSHAINVGRRTTAHINTHTSLQLGATDLKTPGIEFATSS